MEYHRQGCDKEFLDILEQCEKSLQDADVMEVYNKRDDHVESMAKIFETLASKSLSEFAKAMSSPSSTDDDLESYRRKIGNYLKKADALVSKQQQQAKDASSSSSGGGKAAGGEYSSLIKGFKDLLNGDLASAEANFRTVQNAARGAKVVHAPSQQKAGAGANYSFAAFIGNGIVCYAKMKWQSSLESFGKALQENPGCGASVRVAIAACLFKMELYEKAQAAVDAAFSIDPRNVHCLVLMALLEQVLALKNRSRRFEHRARANDYWAIVRAMDSNNASALVRRLSLSFPPSLSPSLFFLSLSLSFHVSMT